MQKCTGFSIHNNAHGYTGSGYTSSEGLRLYSLHNALLYAICTTAEKDSGYSGYILADIKRLHSLHGCRKTQTTLVHPCRKTWTALAGYTPGQRLKLHCFYLCRKTGTTPLQENTGYNIPTRRQRLHWFHLWGRKNTPLTTVQCTPPQEDIGYNRFSIVGRLMLHWL